MTASDPRRPLDLAGVGIGPANLSLAALAHAEPAPRAAFFEQRPAFHWHPGLLIEGTTLQVPFLADLVTLADPTSPWSFLNYLRHQQRLFPFYFAERFHSPRAEYDAYCRWVSDRLTTLHYGHRVDRVGWSAEHAVFELDFTRLGQGREERATGRAYARNVVLGIGTAPHVPVALRPLTEKSATGARPPAVHSADYLSHRDRLLAAGHITVVGSGQSGAEIFLDLLRHRPEGRERLHWLTRSPAFAPMEYSKLGLEHFTPDYTRYFHALPEPVRDRVLAGQGQLYKAIDQGTLAAIHDELYRRGLGGGWPDARITPGVRVGAATASGAGRLELRLEHTEQDESGLLTTDALILATGYRQRPLNGLLAALGPAIRRDAAGRPAVDAQYRLGLDPEITGGVYVQNAELHTHGVGAPDLGLAAHRSAVILNCLTGQERYPLPRRTAFTTFGLRSEAVAAQNVSGGRLSEPESGYLSPR